MQSWRRWGWGQCLLPAGILVLAGCEPLKPADPLYMFEQATACISVTLDAETPVLDGYEAWRVTNTCPVVLNVAYCVSRGLDPVCPAVEQPMLSPDESVRAQVEAETDGMVSVGACQPPERVQTGDGTWYCEEIN